MLKRGLILLISMILFCSSVFSVGAYDINDYEMHHKAGLVAFLNNDTIIYEKNSNEKIYPASITKLMTAIIMLENINDLENEYITYSRTSLNLIRGTGSAVYAGDGLKVGERMKAVDALAALLICSSGDVAYAIAEHVGGTIDNFVAMMNQKAKQMRLDSTNYVNPVGLHDDNHYTTAMDIYKLAKYAFSVDKIMSMLKKDTYVTEATNFHQSQVLNTSNWLISPNSSGYYEYAVGGKTGFTSKAGRCLVSLAEHNGYTYIAIVLGIENPNGIRYDFLDSANMFKWAFKNFEYKSLFDSNTAVTNALISMSADYDVLPICFENTFKHLLLKNEDPSLVSYKLTLNQTEFVAPIEKGTVVGYADFYYGGKKIGSTNLVAVQTVEASALLVFFNGVANFFSSTFMIVVYILIAVTVLSFAVVLIFKKSNKNKCRHAKHLVKSKEKSVNVIPNNENALKFEIIEIVQNVENEENTEEKDIDIDILNR